MTPPIQPEPWSLLPQWLQNAQKTSQDAPGSTNPPKPRSGLSGPLEALTRLNDGLKRLMTPMADATNRDIADIRHQLSTPKGRMTFMAGMIGPGELGAAAGGAAERIVAAAIRDPDNPSKIYRGRLHIDAADAGAKEGASWARLADEWDRGTDNVGFVTDRDRFLTRAEAAQHAKAGGQLRKPQDFAPGGNTDLLAEDLKPAWAQTPEEADAALNRRNKPLTDSLAVAGGRALSGAVVGRPTPALRLWAPDKAGKMAEHRYTGVAHPFARLDAEAVHGDLLDENFVQRFKEEEGFLHPKDGTTWMTRKEAYAYAKKHGLIGGNAKAVENVKRSGQMKAEALRAPTPQLTDLPTPALPSDAEIAEKISRLQKKLGSANGDYADQLKQDLSILQKRSPKSAPSPAPDGQQVFHGTDADFTGYQPSKTGIWFTDTENSARRFGKNVKPASIDLKKPYVYEGSGEHMAELDDPRTLARLRSEGYDGVIVKNEGRPSNYMVFDPSQIRTPAEKGFGLGGHIPEQKPLTYFRGPNTKPEELAAAYEMARKTFDARGPFRKWLKAGGEFPGASPWYDTRGMYRDAADEIGEDAAAKRVNGLLGGFMPASTALSKPPSNLKRAFIWEALARHNLITPGMVRSQKIVMPNPFGHIAQTTAHQPAIARLLEHGDIDAMINPKPASFGQDLTGNTEAGVFDTVMGEIAREIDPKMNRFFSGGAEGKSPKKWAYGPMERGLADAAHDAAKRGLLDFDDATSPVGPYQSLGWHGQTRSADYGSMMDIYRRLRKESAKMWGVSEKRANEMIWKEGRVPGLPLDSPLMLGTVPLKKILK